VPVDRGVERAGGVPSQTAPENDLNMVRAANIEIVGDQRLEEPAQNPRAWRGAVNTMVRDTST
jgi:hypothetical protein